VDHKHGLTPIVSIGKFNNILRESHELFNSMVQAGQPEAVEFNGYLRGIGENNLEYYHYLLSTNNSDKITEFRGANVGIQRFYSLATQDVYRYQTIFGITSQWNFLGVALAKSEATSLASLDMTRSTSNVYVLNVVVGEKAQVFNYWGTIKTAGVGCRVFLVLRRVKLPNDAWGQFQVTTASYSTRDTVPAARRHYMERKGFVWNLGIVSQHSGQAPREGAREASLGLNTSEKDAHQSSGTLPLMYIQLGI
jgi:hypothetical protein